MLRGKVRRALDSTVLDDAVATQDTVTHALAHDYDDPGKPRIAWDDPAARAELVDGLVGDAHRVLGHLPDQELDPKASEAVALLALIAGQDVEPVPDSDGRDGR